MEPKELRNYRYRFGLSNAKTGKQKPVSQRKFAQILDISLSYYKKMEQGKRPIPEEVKQKLEEYFRVYIVKGHDKM